MIFRASNTSTLLINEFGQVTCVYRNFRDFTTEFSSIFRHYSVKILCQFSGGSYRVTTVKQLNSIIHFRLMAQLFLNCVSLQLHLSRSRLKLVRASRSETLMLTQLKESRAIREKELKNWDSFRWSPYWYAIYVFQDLMNGEF